MKKRLSAVLLVVMLGCCHLVVRADQGRILERAPVLIASTIEQDTALFITYEKLISALAEEMGDDLLLIHLPGKRGGISLQEGLVQADLARIYAYDQFYPGIIRVEEPILSIRFVAYSRIPDIEIDDWDSLKPYRIVTMRGHVFADEYMPDHNRHTVGSIESAFAFLKSGRADIFVTTDLEGENFLLSNDFDRAGIYLLQQPLGDLRLLYTFFAPEHEAIAERYLKALKKLKETGRYNRLIAFGERIWD